MKNITLLGVLSGLTAVTPLGAQTISQRCSGDEYRAFDFWLGEWNVVNRAATTANPQVAVNRISLASDGCALREEYSNGTYSGTSLSYYDATSQQWRQTWVDNQGASIIMAGTVWENSLSMSWRANGAGHRLTWTLLDTGQVRQHWERSEDDGRTWTTVFDGRYTKRE